MPTYRLYQAVAFKLRGLLMVPLVAFLIFWHYAEWEFEVGNWGLGLLVFGLGVFVRIVAQRHLKYRLRDQRALASTGPYAWMRNPVYIGNMLIIAGLCLLCELPWMIPPACLWAWFVYDTAIRYEEYRLSRRFGDEYDAYRRSVPRWLPNRAPRVAVAGSQIAGWARAAGVEWQCFVLLLIPTIKEMLF